MPLKFLIDECLSPDLVQLALDAGHSETTCVRNRGWSGLKDHQIMRIVLEGDYTLVTHNARDFRGPNVGGQAGLYSRQEFHAGLVCLTADEMSLELQREMFNAALADLSDEADLTNMCLEIVASETEFEISRHEIPRPGALNRKA